MKRTLVVGFIASCISAVLGCNVAGPVVAQSPAVAGSAVLTFEAKMLAISARYPNFAGLYAGENGALNINYYGTRPDNSILALISELFADRPGRFVTGPVSYHEVAHSYRELHRFMYVDLAELGRHRLNAMIGIDIMNNQVVAGFDEGVSREEVDAIVQAAGVPADAVRIRTGGVGRRG